MNVAVGSGGRVVGVFEAAAVVAVGMLVGACVGAVNVVVGVGVLAGAFGITGPGLELLINTSPPVDVSSYSQ